MDMDNYFLTYTEASKSYDPLSEAIIFLASNFKPSCIDSYVFKKKFAINYSRIDNVRKENFGTFFIATSDNGIPDAILNSDFIHINVYNKLYKVNFGIEGCQVNRLR